MITPERQLAGVQRLIEHCQQTRFWGELVLTIKDGDIKMAATRKTIPIDKLVRGIPDGYEAQSRAEDAEASRSQE